MSTTTSNTCGANSTNTCCSLTAPADRGDCKFRIALADPQLTDDEVTNATQALVDLSFTNKFRNLERSYADPELNTQRFGLISFIPSKGATPDKDGVYGMAKLRGNFQTEVEAAVHAGTLIKNTDSYHKIFTAYVGRPFPITNDEKYCKETEEVDIQQKTKEIISEDVKEKRQQQKKDMEDVKTREKRLIDQQKNPEYEEEPFEKYMMLNTKKAQLCFTYEETMQKIEKVKAIIISARAEILQMEAENPQFKDELFENFKSARTQSGITTDSETMKNTFVKFLCQDIDLGF